MMSAISYYWSRLVCDSWNWILYQWQMVAWSNMPYFILNKMDSKIHVCQHLGRSNGARKQCCKTSQWKQYNVRATVSSVKKFPIKSTIFHNGARQKIFCMSVHNGRLQPNKCCDIRTSTYPGSNKCASIRHEYRFTIYEGIRFKQQKYRRFTKVTCMQQFISLDYSIYHIGKDKRLSEIIL